MRPGMSSETGFLNAHERLLDVIRRDEAACQKLGVSLDQVADRLESIVVEAYRLADLSSRAHPSSIDVLMAGDEAGIVVDDRFRVTGRHLLGRQGCPFEDEASQRCKEARYASADFTIENLRYGERSTLRHVESLFRRPLLEFPGLAIHLIRDHHFFEGSVRYRLAPRRAIAVLENQPGLDYTSLHEAQ